MSEQAAAVAGAGLTLDIQHLARPQDPGLATEFHRWPLPDYVWPALERCYGSIFCSESQLRISGSLTARIEAWVARRDGCITSIILFDRYGRQVRVLNEVFTLAAEALSAFADAVFEQYRELRIIQVRTAFIDTLPTRYLCLSAEVSDDYQLLLPASAEAWQRSLSARTREKCRYHLRRAQQRAPTLSFRTMRSGEFHAGQIKQIIAFNRARMQAKGKRFGMSASDEHQLCQLMLERGQLSVIEIEGKPRAGLLCTRVGGEVFMHVIAHDPALDELRLGFLCCVLTIEDAIATGDRCFHFLWGRYDYKTRLGGKRKLLSRVLLFRHPWGLLQQPGLGFAHALAVGRAWLRQQRHRRTTAA